MIEGEGSVDAPRGLRLYLRVRSPSPTSSTRLRAVWREPSVVWTSRSWC